MAMSPCPIGPTSANRMPDQAGRKIKSKSDQARIAPRNEGNHSLSGTIPANLLKTTKNRTSRPAARSRAPACSNAKPQRLLRQSSDEEKQHPRVGTATHITDESPVPMKMRDCEVTQSCHFLPEIYSSDNRIQSFTRFALPWPPQYMKA